MKGALTWLAIVVALGSQAGCTAIPIPLEGPKDTSPAAPQTTQQYPTTAAVGNPRLYARDGSVVDASPRGSVEPRETLSHDLQPSGGGRMYILELYQEVMNERDDLQRELYQVSEENKKKSAALAEAEIRYAQLEEHIGGLEQEKRQLVEENLDLAGRLTTAQIRRLEAERLLLKSRILEAQDSVGETAAVTNSSKPEEQP